VNQTMKKLIFSATGDSHVGKRENNEDVFLFTENLFVVADGIGGHNAGEVAANYAIAVIEEVVRVMSQGKQRDPAKVLCEAISIANRIIRKHQKTTYAGMGTTVVALYAYEGKAAIGHAGDSRCYRLRKESFRQLTSDHSDGTHMIHRSLGHRAIENGDIQEVDMQAGDIFLLCSDGLNVLSDARIKKILKESGEAEDLVRTALELKDHQQDNVTAIVIRVKEDTNVRQENA
jgi:PPM family protein phosphatase